MTLHEFKRALSGAMYVAAATQAGAYVTITKREALRYAQCKGATVYAYGRWVIIGGDIYAYKPIDNAVESANVANT